MVLPDRCVIAENRFGRYCVPQDASRRPAAFAVLSGRIWEQGTLAFICNEAQGGDVVHAGAFFGDFLPALSHACTNVWACEPVSTNFEFAECTVELNRLENVHLRNAALSSESGSRVMVTRDQQGRPLGGLSRIVTGVEADPRTETVEVIKIDDLVPGDADVKVIHLDVEGHEEWALAGAHATIERCQPVIVSESPISNTALSALCAPVDYHLRLCLDRNYVYGPGRQRSLDRVVMLRGRGSRMLRRVRRRVGRLGRQKRTGRADD